MKITPFRLLLGALLALPLVVVPLFQLGRSADSEQLSATEGPAAQEHANGSNGPHRPARSAFDTDNRQLAARQIGGAEPPIASALEHPTPGTSVREVLEALDARARGGDALAACRLMSELRLCKRARDWTPAAEQAAVDRLAAYLGDEDDIDDSARQLQAIVDTNNRTKAACEGITDADVGKLPEYAFAGALAGHVPAMSAFASATEINGERMVADPALYNTYRQHAWPMFQRAIEAGYPYAVGTWSWALNSGGYAYFAGVIPPEWRKPEVARLLNDRLRAEQGQIAAVPAAPDLDPAVIAEAEALYRRHFENSRWLERKPMVPRAPRQIDVPKYELELKYCEPPAP